MSKLVTVFTLIASVVILGTSCEREILEPTTQDTEITARILDQNEVPTQSTNTPIQSTLIEEGGNVVGTFDISNTSTDVMILNPRFTHGWLMTDAMIFVGDRNNVPKGGSNIVLEEMDFQFHLSNPRNQAVFQIPIGNQAPCFDVVFWFRAQQLDFFGQPVATTTGWADGNAILNGYFQNFCPSPANVQSSSSQSSN